MSLKKVIRQYKGELEYSDSHHATFKFNNDEPDNFDQYVKDSKCIIVWVEISCQKSSYFIIVDKP